MSNFDPNAILRGAQLTLVGAHRALQNPALFKSAHYRQAVLAVAIGIFIRVIISLPIIFVRFFLYLIKTVVYVPWDGKIVSGISFLEDAVLQLPLFMMSLMRYIVPTLDEMFMMSLEWVDRTYVEKHSGGSAVVASGVGTGASPYAKVGSTGTLVGGRGIGQADDGSNNVNTTTAATTSGEIDGKLYHRRLSKYKRQSASAPAHKNPRLKTFLLRSLMRAAISITIYLLTFLPSPIGPLVLPASAFYSIQRVAGSGPGITTFLLAIVLPRRWMVRTLSTYFSSRSLMRELLEPYFSRIPYTPAQKARWFRDREGLLFGFAVGFLFLMKIPLVGVLVYGIAEASTAYLITKITDPPPDVPYLDEEKAERLRRKFGLAEGEEVVDVAGSRAELEKWCENTEWRSKKEFMKLPLEVVDMWNRIYVAGRPAKGVNGEKQAYQGEMRYAGQFPG